VAEEPADNRLTLGRLEWQQWPRADFVKYAA
jgi:hypothetical protein